MGKITTVDGVRKLAKKVSNWGRWGPDDELGTVNHVTQDTIVKAAGLVRKGRVFQLAIELNKNGPQRHGHKGSTRFNPIHVMFRSGSDTVAGIPQALSFGSTWGGADDMIALSTHGASHWDALCHVHGEGGKMWNGYEAALCSSWGAEKNGIEKYGNKLVGRGILLDVARYKGTKMLEPGYEISIEDLDACAEWEGVCVEPGDFLLVRTGKMETYLERVKRGGDWGDYSGGDEAGLAIETAAWLHEREVAGVAMDNWGCEVRPNATGAAMYQPWHRVVLPYMGLLMGENLCFKALAEDCDVDKVYEFLFVAPPLLITGGAGTPINPYAIK